ncbi:MAG: 4-alpha-glucanotransferase, partial [Oscillospiraceae bacterium]|nr:4-alpha-glucanotransferase [Oscillospiraceae bacterium]
MTTTRQSGILLHITSLPSPHGIGTMGQAAYEFADFLRDAGQKCWQVLPLGPTGYGDSPYQSASAFGGTPYLIDLDILAGQGLLTPEEIAAPFWGSSPDAVDYGAMYENRLSLLRKAFDRFTPGEDYQAFLARAGFWLEDYALFQALKTHFSGLPWSQWPEDIHMRAPEALSRYRTLLAEQLDFHRFVQFEFFTQWEALRTYAHSLDIQIIGDVPLYPPLDSADVWANPQLFQLDSERRPACVSGVPPDDFAPEGQLWGNPIYD